jgi:hypothetical protein
VFPWLALVETPECEQDLTSLMPQRSFISAQPVERIGWQAGEAQKSCQSALAHQLRRRRKETSVRIPKALRDRRHFRGIWLTGSKIAGSVIQIAFLAPKIPVFTQNGSGRYRFQNSVIAIDAQDTITLSDVLKAQLHASDFHFV